MIDLLIEETKHANLQGKDFDIASSVSFQLPFFSCMNIILDNQAQKDISQYIYCKEFGIPPFKGDYGMQPRKWIDKVNIIKSTIDKRNNRLQKKIQKQEEAKQGVI